MKGLGQLFIRLRDHPGPTEAGNQRHTEEHPPGKRKALINCVARLYCGKLHLWQRVGKRIKGSFRENQTIEENSTVHSRENRRLNKERNKNQRTRCGLAISNIYEVITIKTPVLVQSKSVVRLYRAEKREREECESVCVSVSMFWEHGIIS